MRQKYEKEGNDIMQVSKKLNMIRLHGDVEQECTCKPEYSMLTNKDERVLE